MKSENFKNIKPKINFNSELEFEKFLNIVAEKIKMDEILTDEETEFLKKNEIEDGAGKKLF